MRKSEKFNMSVSTPKVLVDIMDEHANKAGVSRAEYVRALIARDVIAPISADDAYKLTYIVSRANVADIDRETIISLLKVFTVEVKEPEFNMPDLEKKREEEASAQKVEQDKRKKYEGIIKNETSDPVSEITRPVEALRNEIREEGKRRGVHVPPMSDVDLM